MVQLTRSLASARKRICGRATLTKLRDAIERLFAQLAGYPLGDWIADRRDQGKSWRQIERDLRDEYDIELTNVTLLAWYGAATSDAA